MSERRIYIDYNATTPLRAEVKAAMIQDLNVYGNASSMHTEGRLARARVEEARMAVGKLIGAPHGDIIFTSGGSESNNTVFQTMYRLVTLGAGEESPAAGRNGIVITAVEHPCVLNSAAYLRTLGLEVHTLPVDEYGKVNIGELKKILNKKTLLVSVMAANNEIGTVQDIAEITALVKDTGAFMHTDAVQAAGKIPFDAVGLGVDYLTLSAHKIYGPKGAGALYVRNRGKRDGAPIHPLINGGHQEDGLRAGTYNNTGILGFGKAAELAVADLERYGREIGALRNRLRDGLASEIPNIKFNGHPFDVLPNTLNVSFPGAEGEAILLSMDIMGIEASTGSACASGSLEPSHVIMALGVESELAHGSIRFSLGWGIGADDIDYIIETLPPIISRLRSMSTLAS